MMFARDYRAQARAALKGKWKKTVLIMLLAMLLGAGLADSGSGVSFSSSDVETLLGDQVSREMMIYMGVVSAAAVLISLWGFFMGGFVRVGLVGALNRSLDGETPRAGMLFPKGVYWKSVGLTFMKSLFIGLWSLLFVIPGIIASYRYSMAEYILSENPNIGVMDAIRESKARMAGRKWSLFCLEISFIGWNLLCMVPGWIGLAAVVLVAKFAGLPLMSAAVVIPIFIGGLLSFIAGLFVYTYQITAEVAFFRDADRGGQWREEARAGEEYAESNYGGTGEAGFAPVNPVYGQTAPAEPMLSADETVAKDVYLQHKCSYSQMEREGVLAEYLLLKPSAISETRWRRDYAGSLMRRFDLDPAALDDLLSLAAEYTSVELVDRMLSRIERHLRQQTLPDGEIADMCGRVLALLVSGAFDGDAGFVSRKKEQIADMADRLTARLSESDPDGSWRQTLQLIRSLCA